MADLGGIGYSVPLGVSCGARYSGNHRVVGVTISAGNPVSRRVLLTPQRAPGIVVREVTSDANGVWAFNYVKAGVYLALGIDDGGFQNGVVASQIESEPME